MQLNNNIDECSIPSDDKGKVRSFDMGVFTSLYFLFLLATGGTSILGLNELIAEDQMDFFLLSIIATGVLLLVVGVYYEWKYKFTFLSN
jgi:hypothetical protein